MSSKLVLPEYVMEEFEAARAAEAANRAAFAEERSVLATEPRTAEERADMNRALDRVHGTRAALHAAALNLYFALSVEMEDEP